MADQQAAMFGECCFNTGDVKITMGTGTFMDINTGCKPHTSVAGMAERWQVSCTFVLQGRVTSVAPPPCRSLSFGGMEDRLRGGLPGRGKRCRHGHRHQLGAEVGWEQLESSFFYRLQAVGIIKSHLVRPWRQVQRCLVCGVVAELFTDVQDTSAMAYSVNDSDGVCFVPSFSGLQVLLDTQ